LGTVPAAVSNLAFTAMLADVVPARDRAQVVSVRNVLFAVVTTLSVLVVGKAIDVLSFPFSYQLVFGLAFVTSLASLFYLGRVVIPNQRTIVEKLGAETTGWIQTLRSVSQHKQYSRFTLALFVCHWTQYFAVPLYAIYRVRVLHLSEGWMGLLSMIESAVTILTWYVWGRVAHRRGSRYVLILGVLGLCYYPFGTALARQAWPLIVVAVVAGIVGPAFSLGMLNSLLELAPESHRATYVGLFNMLINIPACISPLLGTAVAGWLGVRTALFVGASLRVVGFLTVSLILRMPSAQGQPRRPAQQATDIMA
jgi:MFS-type transporter involved in bile tolerance (Atg22 family)